MSHSLFEQIVDIENFERAYRQTQKGKGKYKNESLIFNRDSVYNLEKLRRSVIDGSYEFSGYTRFTVYEPKERIIDAPFLPDKIVQIAINNVLKEIYFPSFIYDSYSCIDAKGTHRCVERISYFMRKASWEYGKDAQILKIDIKKFFYTIDRGVLKSILPKKITCRKTLDLLFKIIDSADSISLLGMPLGNTLSQLASNIYMNKLDQYCKRQLSIRYYIRYADDIVIAVKDKDEAIQVLKLIVVFLREYLNLNVNERKTKIFPISQGVNTVGFKIHKTHRLLRNDSKKKIKRRAKKMRRLLIERKVEPEKAEQILNSWLGHAKYGCSYNFIQKLIKRNDYIVLIDGKLKVDMKKIERERAEYDLQRSEPMGVMST